MADAKKQLGYRIRELGNDTAFGILTGGFNATFFGIPLNNFFKANSMIWRLNYPTKDQRDLWLWRDIVLVDGELPHLAGGWDATDMCSFSARSGIGAELHLPPKSI